MAKIIPQFIETGDIDSVPEIEGQLVFTDDGKQYHDSSIGRIRISDIVSVLQVELDLLDPIDNTLYWTTDAHTLSIAHGGVLYPVTIDTSGFVTLATSQTISGEKTFEIAPIFQFDVTAGVSWTVDGSNYPTTTGFDIKCLPGDIIMFSPVGLLTSYEPGGIWQMYGNKFLLDGPSSGTNGVWGSFTTSPDSSSAGLLVTTNPTASSLSPQVIKDDGSYTSDYVTLTTAQSIAGQKLFTSRLDVGYDPDSPSFGVGSSDQCWIGLNPNLEYLRILKYNAANNTYPGINISQSPLSLTSSGFSSTLDISSINSMNGSSLAIGTLYMEPDLLMMAEENRHTICGAGTTSGLDPTKLGKIAIIPEDTFDDDVLYGFMNHALTPIQEVDTSGFVTVNTTQTIPGSKTWTSTIKSSGVATGFSYNYYLQNIASYAASLGHSGLHVSIMGDNYGDSYQEIWVSPRGIVFSDDIMQAAPDFVIGPDEFLPLRNVNFTFNTAYGYATTAPNSIDAGKIVITNPNASSLSPKLIADNGDFVSGYAATLTSNNWTARQNFGSNGFWVTPTAGIFGVPMVGIANTGISIDTLGATTTLNAEGMSFVGEDRYGTYIQPDWYITVTGGIYGSGTTVGTSSSNKGKMAVIPNNTAANDILYGFKNQQLAPISIDTSGFVTLDTTQDITGEKTFYFGSGTGPRTFKLSGQGSTIRGQGGNGDFVQFQTQVDDYSSAGTGKIWFEATDGGWTSQFGLYSGGIIDHSGVLTTGGPNSEGKLALIPDSTVSDDKTYAFKNQALHEITPILLYEAEDEQDFLDYSTSHPNALVIWTGPNAP